MPEKIIDFGLFKVDQNIIIFGGFNSENMENKKAWEISYQGETQLIAETPVKGSFSSHQAGKFGASYIISTRNGSLLTYNSKNKRFYLVSIGNNEGFTV